MGGRLKGWKSESMSPPGRGVMANTMLESLLVYTMPTFILPKTITKRVTNTIRDFWWEKLGPKKGMYIKGWRGLCKSKEKWGNGLKKLDLINISLIAKNGWRLFHQPNNVFTKTMRGKYFPNSNPFHDTCNDGSSWAWKSVYKCLMILKDFSIWQIGNGPIWKEWIPGEEGNPIKLEYMEEVTNLKMVS
ncbi:uncharacterized protein LOC113312311 [Papaver somniferum]|uniref:uncharacterized protein LOC113312311 n=1 Tax=Papaver somniferum TaxID=3469 RepID=UPI000E6F632A|nr:uncharacterized protein LOC113312311 [Papaver somniferum]